MNLSRFWPSEADCLQCIKPEAENPSDAVFLAVHQEMRFVRESFATGQKEKRPQRQLLNEFLRDEPSGRVILPILGDSGVGKSHLVRWLDVQLRQRKDRDQRHVIRIPKSSSLKSVLGRILDGLEGPQYEDIRHQLQSAREQMDDISARQRIRAELLATMERNYEAAKERKAKAQVSGETLDHRDRLWYGHGDPRALPALLNDPATQVLFTQGTTARPGIISELARHVTKDTSLAETPRRQFEAADFLIPDELADRVKEAGPIAGRYLSKLQRTTARNTLDEAVDLLNGIVDDAIEPLATPTDMSLAELFYDVRQLLLADDRELVLLVEDFAVLAGVQRALLDAIIREGETGGKQEACTIRTALAVTTGYLGNLDTVKTRAVHGWSIETGEDEDEETVTNQIGNFVATYVNAARIGAKRLETHYSKSANVGKSAPQALDFIHPEEDELAVLASFGQSADGFSLFPFNQAAIRTIADRRLRNSKGRLLFHPRSIINEMILPVVKDTRASFERGEFPPEHFLDALKWISYDLTQDVSRKVSDPHRQSQYLLLFYFWGEKPDSLADVQIPSGVFTAFGLTPLAELSQAAHPETLKPLTTDEQVKRPATRTTVPADGSDRDVPPALQKFLGSLDAWRSGDTLGQREANEIRKWINAHVLYSINWEAELLRPIKPTTKEFAQSICLPNARGNPPDSNNAFIVVATDEQFQDVSIANDVFAVCRALARYDHFNGWDYPEADGDYNVLTNFIDAQLPDAVEWIRNRYDHLDGSPVPALTQSLLWQARVLNVDSAHRSDDASHIDAVFATAPEIMDRDDDADWWSYLDEMAARRPAMIEELLKHVAAVQGIGKTPYAVDASRLLPTIQEFRKTWEISKAFPKPPGGAENSLRQMDEHIKSLNRFGVKRVEERQKKIAKQSQRIVSELGTEYDKHPLLNDLEEVCALAEQHGLGGETSVASVRKLAAEFRDAPAKEASNHVEAIVTGKDLGSRMSAIATLDLKTHALLVDFVETCSKFLQERSGQADAQIADWTEEVVEAAKAKVDAILSELEAATESQQVTTQ